MSYKKDVVDYRRQRARQKGDYGDFVTFDGDKVNEWLNQAEDAVRELEAAIDRLQASEKKRNF